MTAVRQPSFAGGELAPQLWGRNDLPRYALGSKRLYNFFVPKQGYLLTRPGAQYLAKASSAVVIDHYDNPNLLTGPHYQTAGAGVRLLPFLWSDVDTGQNAVLIFGEKSIQILQGGVVAATASGTVPYLRADLFKIQIAQSGDTVFIACGGYPPATLKRTGPTTWVYAAVSFDARTPTVANPMIEIDTIGATDADHPAKIRNYIVTELWRDGPTGTEYETWGAFLQKAWQYAGAQWRVDFTYSLNDTISNGGHFFKSLQANNKGNAPTIGGTAFWQDLGVSLTSPQDPSGLFDPKTPFPCYGDRPVTIKVSFAAVPTDPNFLGFRYYAGQGLAFGWIGDSNGGDFVDVGDEPDMSQPPPQGINPFKVTDVGGLNARTENPLAVTFFEDSLLFGGTEYQRVPARAAFIFKSASGDYYNFDSRYIPSADEALLFALAARRREVIRTLYGGERLFCFTDCALWSVRGSNGPMGPGSIEVQLQVNVGSSYLQPIQVDETLLWVRSNGTGVLGVNWSFELQKYAGHDLSYPAQHLLWGHSIVDWAYAPDPWGVIWAARDDGLLMSVARSEDDGIWGWEEHQVVTGYTPAATLPNFLGGTAAPTYGAVQSVCSIPENGEDAVYLAMAGPAPATWNNTKTYATGDLSTFGSFGGPVYTFSSLQNANLNNLPDPSGADTAWWRKVESSVGPSWIMRLSTRVEAAGKTPVGLDCYVEYDSNFTTGGGAISASGLDHLEGQYVWALFDTNEVKGPFTVAGGFCVVPAPSANASKLFVGTLFSSELVTLGLPQERTKQKVVTQVALEVSAPGGTVQAGSDLQNLDTFSGNLDGTLATADVVKIPTSGTWNTTGQAAVRHVGPLPLTVVALTREVVSGEG